MSTTCDEQLVAKVTAARKQREGAIRQEMQAAQRNILQRRCMSCIRPEKQTKIRTTREERNKVPVKSFKANMQRKNHVKISLVQH